jgi:hypothetical protein
MHCRQTLGEHGEIRDFQICSPAAVLAERDFGICSGGKANTDSGFMLAGLMPLTLLQPFDSDLDGRRFRASK